MSNHENLSPKRPIPISTAEFDRKVEAGEDIDDHLDWENAVTLMPGEFSAEVMLAIQAQEHADSSSRAGQSNDGVTLLQVSLPDWIHDKLQNAAMRKGVSQEAMAQFLIMRQLEQEKALS